MYSVRILGCLLPPKVFKEFYFLFGGLSISGTLVFTVPRHQKFYSIGVCLPFLGRPYEHTQDKKVTKINKLFIFTA
jgi:hypothetical protein